MMSFVCSSITISYILHVFFRKIYKLTYYHNILRVVCHVIDTQHNQTISFVIVTYSREMS